MSNGPVLPEIPDSWMKLVREIATIVLLIVNLIFSVWTKAKTSDVQTHQEVNTQKLDVAAQAATEAKHEAVAAKQTTAANASKIDAKLDTLNQKAEVIRSAVKPK